MKFKKVLMIVYYFPPLAGPGSIRYSQFSKYLPTFRWKPYILTVKNPSKLILRDYSLKVPNSLKIYRAISLPLFIIWKIAAHLIGYKNAGFFFVPDGYTGWILDAIRKGYSIIRKEKIDLIFVGCTPHSAAIIGYILKKLTKKPLVIDFRDPYVESPYNDYPSKIYKYINKKLEQKFIQTANRVITVTSSFVKYFPYKEKFAIIPNGYFNLVQENDYSIKKYKKFTISTLGTIYSEQVWVKFLKALKKFQEKKETKSLQLLFIGHKHQKLIEPIAKKLNILDIIRYTGYIPNEKCNNILKKSHILVIILPKEKNSALVVKVFSYLHSNSPILGIMDQSSETAKFIKKSNIGIIVPNTVQDIVKGLLELSRGIELKRNWDYIRLFDRKILTEKLAKLFNKIIEKKQSK